MRYLLALLLAFGAFTSADASRFHVIKHQLPIPVAPSGGTYDTSIGTSVDVDGFAQLPLHAGAHQYYVNSATGTNAETCTDATDPTKPVADIDTALVFCVTSGEGDHILVAEGTSYSFFIHGFIAGKDGFSAQYPTVIESYDPADPLNTAKYGRGDQRNARPIIAEDFTGAAGSPNFGGILGGSNTSSYFAIKGIDFAPPNQTQESLFMSGASINYFLLENNIFRFMSISLDFGAPAFPLPSHHYIARNNALYGGFNVVNGRSGGFYVGGIDSVTLEDNVLWNTGFQVGGTRHLNVDGSTNPNYGTQSHPAYIQTSTSNVAFRRNLIIDPSSDAGILRSLSSGNSMTENVVIHSPNGMVLGPDSSHWDDYTQGGDYEASYNLLIAGISNGEPGGNSGQGWGGAKGNPGSRIHHNLTVANENLPPCCGNDPGLFSNVVQIADHTSYMEHENNLSYLWNISGEGEFIQPDPLGALARPYTTYDNNFWDDPASGTNAPSSGLTFPHAYTLSTLLTAAGYADLNALVTAVIAHPELHVQRTLRTLAFAGYGRADHAIDVVAPNLSSPTATGGTGSATIGVTTDDSTGKLYYELLTTGTAPHVSRIKMGVDSSDAPAPKAGSLVITSSGTKSISVSSVPAGTYYVHFVHEDAEDNKSTAVTAGPFTVS